jgi:hypothetical protein
MLWNGFVNNHGKPIDTHDDNDDEEDDGNENDSKNEKDKPCNRVPEMVADRRT